MNRLDFFRIIERNLTYQNPTSEEKLDRLIDCCMIEDGQRVLDVACGKGWLLQRIAEKYAVTADGVELNPAFIEEGKNRMRRARLRGTVSVQQMPARDFAGEAQSYDVGCCVGASFAIGSFEEMLAWLRAYIKPGGIIAIGDIYARTGQIPKESAAHFGGGRVRTLQDTADQMNSHGLTLVAMIDSSLDDWDRYENAHWLAAEAWARDNNDHPDVREFVQTLEQFKYNHLHFDRAALGWALFVSRVA